MWQKVEENSDMPDANNLNSSKRIMRCPVRRSNLNERKRLNGQASYNYVVEDELTHKKLDITSTTQLEWLAFNFRKERASKLSDSKRRMILAMFSLNLAYFPTLKDIRDELIMAQIYQI